MCIGDPHRTHGGIDEETHDVNEQRRWEFVRVIGTTIAEVETKLFGTRVMCFPRKKEVTQSRTKQRK